MSALDSARAHFAKGVEGMASESNAEQDAGEEHMMLGAIDLGVSIAESLERIADALGQKTS